LGFVGSALAPASRRRTPPEGGARRLYRPWIVHHQDAAGNRVPKDRPGARKVRERARKWYARGSRGLVWLHMGDAKADLAYRISEKLVTYLKRKRSGIAREDRP
jgi:hypothetical protein